MRLELETAIDGFSASIWLSDNGNRFISLSTILTLLVEQGVDLGRARDALSSSTVTIPHLRPFSIIKVVGLNHIRHLLHFWCMNVYPGLGVAYNDICCLIDVLSASVPKEVEVITETRSDFTLIKVGVIE
jgi:hypothetical protein